jgi:hypothetical protein
MKYLPEPSYIDVPGNNSYNYGSYSITITPYQDTRWQEIVGKYGVQIPDIIDMTQGRSKCNQCGALYVGYQPNCNRQVIFHKKSSYHDEFGPSNGYFPIFERECGGPVTWELMEKFSLQREFFSLLDRIRSLPDPFHDPLNKFEEFFPKGVADVIRVRLMKQDLDEIKDQMPMIKSSFEMIAQKMNMAGNNLRF